jgi:hypothetical protein
MRNFWSGPASRRLNLATGHCCCCAICSSTWFMTLLVKSFVVDGLVAFRKIAILSFFKAPLVRNLSNFCFDSISTDIDKHRAFNSTFLL